MRFRFRSILGFGVLLLLVLVAGAAVPLAADTAAEGSSERTLQVTGPVDLQVETGAGRISVRSGDSGTVRVVGSIRANSGWGIEGKAAEEKVRRIEANPPIEQNGNVLRIGRIEDSDLRQNVSISYEFVVPRETRLRSATGSGSQTIDGIRGPLECSTGSGSLKISNLGAEVRASTGSGSIELDTVQGSVHASTGSGHIHALHIAGGFSGHTGSGGVEVEHTAAGDDEIETGSGGVHVRGARGSLRVRTGSGSISAQGEQKGDWRLHTGSGGVTVRLPQEATFDVDARTSSGHITFDHPVTVEGTLRPREIRGKVRGGGPRLEVSTSSGSIRIE